MLTEERRKQLVKQVGQECEHGRVSVRSIRKETNEQIKKIKGGLPLGGGVSLKPDVDIDITKLKIKKVGVILEWEF